MSGIVPFDGADERAHRRQLAAGINRALAGKLACTGVVTLAPGAAETPLPDARISFSSVILLQPQTVSAAAVTPSLHIPPHGNGGAVLRHAAAPDLDLTFSYVVIA